MRLVLNANLGRAWMGAGCWVASGALVRERTARGPARTVGERVAAGLPAAARRVPGRSVAALPGAVSGRVVEVRRSERTEENGKSSAASPVEPLEQMAATGSATAGRSGWTRATCSGAEPGAVLEQGRRCAWRVRRSGPPSDCFWAWGWPRSVRTGESSHRSFGAVTFSLPAGPGKRARRCAPGSSARLCQRCPEPGSTVPAAWLGKERWWDCWLWRCWSDHGSSWVLNCRD